MFVYADGPGRADAVRLNQPEGHINAWNNLELGGISYRYTILGL
jgi:hypothetical protein